MPIKELIGEGDPTKEVIKVVKEEAIDLLIMLAHAEGRLEHFLFGRSNEGLVRQRPSVQYIPVPYKKVGEREKTG